MQKKVHGKMQVNMNDKVMRASELYIEALNSIKIMSNANLFLNIEKVVDLLLECFRNSGKVLIFGNGGSAADAQHICGELVGRFSIERAPLSALALTTDTSVLTAWGNDYDFETIFLRQVEAHGHPRDVAWGISTSGNSRNVLRALARARELGLKTVGLLGNGGGKALALCDGAVAVEETQTPRIQEVHVIIYHIICALVEERMFAHA